MNLVNTDLPRFCPRENCSHFQDTDNLITKAGTYTTKNDPVPRQLYWCHGGEHKFSETAYSALWHKHGSFKEYTQTAKLKAEGLSNEPIADVLERDTRTIATWSSAISEKSRVWHISLCSMIGIVMKFLQLDELWSFIGSKAQQLWVFAALDVPTRFWVVFTTGIRTHKNAKILVGLLYLLDSARCRLLKITTEKFAGYEKAINHYFKDRNFVYLQIVKKRVQRRLKTVKKSFVKGTEDDFPEGTQNTSFIERFNLTIRQKVSYLARKTLGFCRKAENMDEALWINLFDYNYRQPHHSLRVRLPGRPKKERFKKRYRPCTPGMKMGLTTAPVDWKFLFIVPIPM
jgi:IS1 family transposase